MQEKNWWVSGGGPEAGAAQAASRLRRCRTSRREPAATDAQSRRSCSGWVQPPPSAVPARLGAGLTTGIPAATRLLLVARLQPAPGDKRTDSRSIRSFNRHH
jgi:hypothetical protein